MAGVWKLAAAVAAVSALMMACSATVPKPDRPNVMVVVVDDLRPMFGAYGNPYVKTPNLDKLAERSLLFRNAATQFAVCGPSRNSFMTGRRPQSTQTMNFKTNFRASGVDTTGRVGEDWTTLPEAFKNANYVTAGMGKLFHPGSPPNNDCPKPDPSRLAYDSVDGDSILEWAMSENDVPPPSLRLGDDACATPHAHTCLASSGVYKELNDTSVADCCKACNEDNACVSWTVNTQQRQCHLRPDVFTPNPGSECTSGWKQAPSSDTNCPSWSTNFTTTAPANVTLDNKVVTNCDDTGFCQFRYVNPDAQIFDVCLQQGDTKELACALPDDNCTDKWLADAAVATLRQVVQASETVSEESGSTSPFMFMAGFHKPHPFWAIPERYLHMYDSMPLPTHATAPEGAPEVAFYSCDSINSRSPVGGPECETYPDGCQYIQPNQSLANDTMRTIRSAYAGGTSWMDSQVGRVLDELEALGHLNDTILAFWADHGWALQEHGMYCKMANYELQTRVPMMLSVPWMPESMGKVTTAMAELVDMFPTLIDLAGVPVSDTLEGTSLAPVLADPDGTSNDSSEGWHTHAAFNMSFSQYPRCINTSMAKEPPYLGERDPCIKVPSNEFTHMGYSVRTLDWRFTIWPQWKCYHANKCPNDSADWENVDGVELYSHKGDDGTCFDCFENVNVANDAGNAGLVAEFTAILKEYAAQKIII